MCVCVLRSASCSSGGDDDDVAMSTVVYIVGRVRERIFARVCCEV